MKQEGSDEKEFELNPLNLRPVEVFSQVVSSIRCQE